MLEGKRWCTQIGLYAEYCEAIKQGERRLWLLKYYKQVLTGTRNRQLIALKGARVEKSNTFQSVALTYSEVFLVKLFPKPTA
jgi:hypothetical protein